MWTIKSEGVRRILRNALPFAVMPAIVLLLPLGSCSRMTGSRK